MCTGRVGSSCTRRDTLATKPVISHEFMHVFDEVCMIWTLVSELKRSNQLQKREQRINLESTRKYANDLYRFLSIITSYLNIDFQSEIYV